LRDGYGGIEYYLEDLYRYATDVYGEDAVRAIAATRTAAPFPTNGIRYVPYRRSGILGKIENRFSLKFLSQAGDEIKKHHPTILIAGHISIAPMVWLLSQRFQIPMLSIAYGIECWGNGWPQDEIAFRQSDGILSISQWTKNILIQRGFARKKIAILHPSLPDHFAKISARAIDTTPKPFTLLTISRLNAEEQYKGQDHVIQAMALLKKAHGDLAMRYIIQGDGPDQTRLKALVAENELESMVEFRDAVRGRDDLAKTYLETDLFIMPSQFGRRQKRWVGEGFGIVYVEAAAFGVPSIAYDCGGATDIIIEGQTGRLVKPNDIPKLADAIYDLYQNRTKLHAMGIAAKDHVHANFASDIIRSELVTALNQY